MTIVDVSNVTYNWSFDYTDNIDSFEVHHPPGAKAYHYSVAVIFFIVILGGILSNVFGLVILIRCRMWLQHEGYFYLVAIFGASIGILVFDSGTFWFNFLHFSYYPGNTSEFMCKVWHTFMTIFFSSGWLSVALLFNTYLREHLVHRRRCGCPRFANKYCTLYASKVVTGVIFGVLFILGLPYLGVMSLVHHDYDVQTYSVCIPNPHHIFAIVLTVEFFLMWVLPFIFFLPIILLLTLCISREGDRFGFSQLEDRSAADEKFRVLAVTLTSMTFFSQFALATMIVVIGSVKGLYVNSVFQIMYCLSLGLQPIFCLIFMTRFRKVALSKFQCIKCCRRFMADPTALNEDEDLQLDVAVENDPINEMERASTENIHQESSESP